MKKLYVFLITIYLSACLPTEALTPFVSATPSSTETPTPTVVWFPPTDTPTIMPTVLPSATPEMRPGLGGLLFSDDFDLPTDWTLLETESSSISVSNNELTAALSREKGYIYSVREGALFSNFYAEFTASPNLCNGLDEYGMLIRYQSPGNFYRYSLSCDGQVRLDRVVGGTASSPQPWMVTTSVPSAAPSTSRLGVWAVGNEMRFFVNDQHQFTITDKALPSGAMGVFVRSGGSNAVTISFSDLVVYGIEQ
ncbi:MAG: hypothetical protein ISR58_08325 [Anaerolineales bacterium]|nr:hypothetical protein [Chloroflexota bacterium]MBL6981184.1 hypothetical protein [Anaerolineales bacterium]